MKLDICTFFTLLMYTFFNYLNFWDIANICKRKNELKNTTGASKTRLHMKRTFFFFFLVVYYQACAKVQLFSWFWKYQNYFSRETQSMAMFYYFRKGTILLVRHRDSNTWKYNKKQTGKSANCYCKLHCEPCCKQLIVRRTPHKYLALLHHNLWKGGCHHHCLEQKFSASFQI